MAELDCNNRHYQELLRLADHLGAGDANLETWGGPLSAHVDVSKGTSPLWADESAEDRFAEACRRRPDLVDAWKTPGRLAEQWQSGLEAEAAARVARIAAGVPEGLA